MFGAWLLFYPLSLSLDLRGIACWSHGAQKVISNSSPFCSWHTGNERRVLVNIDCLCVPSIAQRVLPPAESASVSLIQERDSSSCLDVSVTFYTKFAFLTPSLPLMSLSPISLVSLFFLLVICAARIYAALFQVLGLKWWTKTHSLSSKR